jgi:splicing factor 3A subunit 2
VSILDAREHGSKPGSGFITSFQENLDRRERLRQLALETIDLDKDPYFIRNHLGQYECRLCLSLHINTGSYLAHTQGKRHQQNLARRAAKEKFDGVKSPILKPGLLYPRKNQIGRPGYRVTKQYDRKSEQRSILFQIDYSEIKENSKPRQRFMSAYEQRKEPTDRKYQYVLFHAEPYEVIAFKIPGDEVDRDVARINSSTQNHITEMKEHHKKIFAYWDPVTKIYTLQIYFKIQK